MLLIGSKFASTNQKTSTSPILLYGIRSLPGWPWPLFQSQAKCKAMDNETHYSKKRFVLSLVLKVRVFGTWKWPISAIIPQTSFHRETSSGIIKCPVSCFLGLTDSA